MKNDIICLLICLCLSSCIKAKEKDYSYLKIQTQLSEKEKKYYENIHNEISEIGKVFAFNPEPDEKTLNNNCLKLEKILQDLSNRSISRERERERERVGDFLYHVCSNLYKKKDIHSKWETYSLAELNYLHSRLPNSARILISLAREETDKALKTTSTRSKEFTQKSIDHYRESLFVDEKDLLSYKDLIDIHLVNKKEQKEYCQKAIEQKQWDHIYYLTKDINSSGKALSCLLPQGSNEDLSIAFPCLCPEAFKLIVKHWPTNILYDSTFLNPSADPMDIKEEANVLREAIKKYAK